MVDPPTHSISPQRRQEIVDALRRGTVPRNSLDAFAVGLDHLEGTLDEELKKVVAGGSVFKAVRGDYGCGKTFFARWLCDRARKMGFATSEVQVSETETPLHRLETVYRRLTERMGTAGAPSGALRNLVDGWFFTLEEDVLAEGEINESDESALLARTNELLEKRLGKVSDTAPTFSAALRGYRKAQSEGDGATAEGILAWLSGQPNVAAAAKRYAGVKGDIDHFGALNFLQGLLTVIRDSGSAGMLVVLDEVETIQRVRSDVRDKSLNALRQLIDEVDSGRFPGLYLLITGTPAFYDGPQGIARLEPLAQRLHVDFQTDARFDNPRAVQIRLPAFSLQRLQLVGCKVRDIYASHCNSSNRIRDLVGDDYVQQLASSVAGKLGGKVGLAPRIFLKKLVSDILDRVDQFDDFDPRQHYTLTMSESELTAEERQAASATDVDEIELDL
nr:BREX system ATP-binding protein BrxD [Rhodopirellula sp. SM50]